MKSFLHSLAGLSLSLVGAALVVGLTVGVVTAFLMALSGLVNRKPVLFLPLGGFALAYWLVREAGWLKRE
jgi:flagellar biosynthesis protein FliQ